MKYTLRKYKQLFMYTNQDYRSTYIYENITIHTKCLMVPHLASQRPI